MDNQNPVFTDNTTISGDGTEEHPLATIPDATAVETDGSSVTGNGTSGSPIELLSKTITLTSAEILTLGTVPVQILPAPGAGKAILPYAGTWRYTPGSIAYSFGAAVEPSVVLQTNAAVPSDYKNNGLISNAESNSGNGGWDTLVASRGQMPALAGVESLVNIENLPLLVTCEDLGVGPPTTPLNPTLGNGTVTITVWYIILSAAE